MLRNSFDVLALAVGAVTVLAATMVLVIVPPFRNWAARQNMLDVPTSRSLHDRPIVRGAGIVISGAATIGIALGITLTHSWSVAAAVFIAGAAGMALLGWADDRRSLSPLARLLVQVGVAFGTTAGIGAFDSVGIAGYSTILAQWMTLPITVLWIVAMANFYNFMDGIDGLAAGQGVISGGCWMIVGLGSGFADIAIIGAAVLGASAAFLVFNWSPASVFMGDAGSLFLGYSVAVVPLLVPDVPGHRVFSELTVLFVSMFLFDATYTLARRTRFRQNVFRPHRSHLYQRLVAAGYGHRDVALGFLSLALIGAIPGLLRADKANVTYVLPAGCAALTLIFWTTFAEQRARRRNLRHQL